MANRKTDGPVLGTNSDGSKFVRKKRPVGFTFSDTTIERLDEMAEEYSLTKSKLMECLIAREFKSWKGGFNCLKDALGV